MDAIACFLGVAQMKWMLLPFARITDYKGRSGRREYWLFQLLITICGLFLALLLLTTGVFAAPSSSQIALSNLLGNTTLLIALGLYLLCILPAKIALTVRRWHDIGNSGWTVLVVILLSRIPLIGSLVWVVNFAAMCWPGDKGSNQYGFPPPEKF
jgi:uncharacterized membrane protein YhaH (DUF805 family)